MVCLVQTVHLSWTYIAPALTLSRNESRQDCTWATSPRSFIECVQNDFRAYGTFSAPILRQDLHYLQIDRNKLPLEPCHLEVPLRAMKMISEPMVCLAEPVQVYCTDTNTVSKWTKTRFHMTHSPRGSIRCVHDDFRAYGTFGTNRAPILRQD
jgi:hypothetical protein